MKTLQKLKDFLFGRSPSDCFVTSQLRVGLFVPALSLRGMKQSFAKDCFMPRNDKSYTAIPNANLNNNFSILTKLFMIHFFQIVFKNKSTLVAIFLLFFSSLVSAQDKFLAKGNKEFNAKKYQDAEANYRISGSKNPKKSIASYNLGNAIYQINQPQEAALAYVKAITETKLRPEKHQSYHNLGNVAMKVKDYTNAVNAYKQALINNPADDETRYNYALAKKLLKENPPKKDDKKKDDKNKDKDKKDKDKKDENKEKDKDKKEDENKKDGDGKDPKPQQPKPEGSGISKQRLENLLDAVNNEEKKVQEKVNKNKQKTTPRKTEKDW